MIAPLAVRKRSWKRIVLVASEETRKTTMPPPMVEIDEQSLVRLPQGPPAPEAVRAETGGESSDDDVDSGWEG